MRAIGDTHATPADSMPDDLEFFATCAEGFEQLLAKELRGLGISQVRPLTGQVAFAGDVTAAYLCCLWSTLASSAICVLGRFDASSEKTLYEGARSVAWERHLAPGTTFCVNARGTNAELRSTTFVAQRVKDAIVDQMEARLGSTRHVPRVDTANPDLRVSVRISRTRATVGVNLSGAPLFERDYLLSGTSRRTGHAAPQLRCDYAAALLAASGWTFDETPVRTSSGDPRTLVATGAGAGTILVEAALRAYGIAPGTYERAWGFTGWALHDAATWEKMLARAREQRERAQRIPLGNLVCLIGIDQPLGYRGREGHGAHEPGHAARSLLDHAGFSISGKRDALRTISPSLSFLPTTDAIGSGRVGSSRGETWLVCDLSHIHADQSAQDAAAIALAASCARALPGGGLPRARHVACLGPADAVRDVVPGDPTSARQTRLGGNHPLALNAYEREGDDASHAFVPLPDAQGTRRALPVRLAASDQFARLLDKAGKARAAWARAEDVTCYRVYDRELSDYALTIDLYEESLETVRPDASPRRWLVINEYAAPARVDPRLARNRLLDALAIAPLMLAIPPERTFLRTRSHSKGGLSRTGGAGRSRHAQRADASSRTRPLLIDEGGLCFEVDFSAHLDVGIFLDHRVTRELIREEVKELPAPRRFLNLFAYTGTATCYAADGGSRDTTTVDLSAPSLACARRNMERNGFVDQPDVKGGARHRFVREDVLAWLARQRHQKDRWDLVFCDVPTFSNSSKMHHRTWDVQRDHVELLVPITRILSPGGFCVFSCNLRGFKPDVEALARAHVAITDITALTIPEDFSRSPHVHRAYLVRKECR